MVGQGVGQMGATLGTAAGVVGNRMPSYDEAIAQQKVASTPKELGLMQRMEGVASGLDIIHRRLYDVCARIVGKPVDPKGEQAGVPFGMPATISACEERLRAISAIIDGMERTF